jgi:hypothetical protein
MTDALAGFMGARAQRREVFDARTVAQRLDLSGDAKICLPMLVDLEAGHDALGRCQAVHRRCEPALGLPPSRPALASVLRPA